mmetsp:Transcript_64041/g.113108  ORF Transcript_64041/g.113108 Transcript_64041/m.113108 type:complete len:337 (+) Transcript_64041:1313-2323(+)
MLARTVGIHRNNVHQRIINLAQQLVVGEHFVLSEHLVVFIVRQVQLIVTVSFSFATHFLSRTTQAVRARSLHCALCAGLRFAGLHTVHICGKLFDGQKPIAVLVTLVEQAAHHADVPGLDRLVLQTLQGCLELLGCEHAVSVGVDAPKDLFVAGDSDFRLGTSDLFVGDGLEILLELGEQWRKLAFVFLRPLLHERIVRAPHAHHIPTQGLVVDSIVIFPVGMLTHQLHTLDELNMVHAALQAKFEQMVPHFLHRDRGILLSHLGFIASNLEFRDDALGVHGIDLAGLTIEKPQQPVAVSVAGDGDRRNVASHVFNIFLIFLVILPIVRILQVGIF